LKVFNKVLNIIQGKKLSGHALAQIEQERVLKQYIKRKIDGN